MASADLIPVEPPFDPVQARPGSRWEGVGFHAQVRAAPAASSWRWEGSRQSVQDSTMRRKVVSYHNHLSPIAPDHSEWIRWVFAAGRCYLPSAVSELPTKHW